MAKRDPEKVKIAKEREQLTRLLRYGRLKLADCLDLLTKVPSDSVDLILTDPPYFQIVRNDWDNQWKTEQEYLDWCALWTKECVRILKPNPCFYVWGISKTDTFLRYKLDVLNSHPELIY